MKFSTLIALTATVSARHLVDGDVAEDVQDQLLDAADDAAKFMEEDMIPNLEQWGQAQEATDRAHQIASENNFNDFVNRGDAAGYDAKLRNIDMQIAQAMDDIEDNIKDNHDLGNFARRAAPQKLWSVGMTASKTAAVNQKLQKVAQDYMAFASDPVYGPFLEQHQTQLYIDIDAAFTKFTNAMESKIQSDPVFRYKSDHYQFYFFYEEGLGQELNNPTGWTFEDNDGALERAANQWWGYQWILLWMK